MSDAENDNVIDTREREDMEEEDNEEELRARVAEMEKEAAVLRELQEAEAKASEGPSAEAGNVEEEDPSVVDARSVYVGNVDYGATPEELQQHFMGSGVINRITILCDRFTGHSKGYAYVEFATPESASQSLSLNESLFRGRQLSVVAKRTNVPGMSARGRGRGRGGFRGGRGSPHFHPYTRGRGRRGRGRGY